MKTKMMKRAAAFAASVLMTAAMAVPAAAFETPKSGNYPPIVYNGKEMGVTKTIYMFNSDAQPIFQPNIEYTFGVEAGTAGKTIKGKIYTKENEETTITTKTKAGVPGGVTLSADQTAYGASAVLKWGDDSAPETATTKEGEDREKEVTKTLYIKADDNQFTEAGVYRYKITQAANLAAAGVMDGSGDDALMTEAYLDVYVKAKDSGDGYEVYGLVLSKKDEDITYDATVTTDSKIDAFDPDEYHTANMKVTKKIEGAMADKNHKFPFKIEIADLVSGAEFYYDVNGTKSNAQADGTTYTIGADGNTKLGNNETLTVYGVPTLKHATPTISEKNDTDSTYSATFNWIKSDSGTYTGSDGEKYKFENEYTLDADSDWTGTSGATILAEYGGVNTMYDEYLVTNTCEAISPTGVLFRMAPYALMMTAGGVLIAVYLRGKKREDAESMI